MQHVIELYAEVIMDTSRKEEWDEETKNLLSQLKRFSLEKRYSMRTLAPMLQAEYTTVWRWYHGKAKPNHFHLYKIRNVLGYV